MRKFYIFKITALLMFQFINYSYGQNDRKHQKFEKKLSEFRYSLYADLENTERMDKIFDKNDLSHPLIKKLKQFINENEKEIRAYQVYKLSKHNDEIINFEQFTKDSAFFSEDGIANRGRFDAYEQMMGIYGKSFGKFISLNPFYIASLIKNIYMADALSASEMGAYSMKDAIAAPKIKCTQKSDQTWKIWFDHYSYLYEFEFELYSGKMKLVGVYTRR